MIVTLNDARAQLGLPLSGALDRGVVEEAVKRCWRRDHPDKGGCEAAFLRTQQAAALLRGPGSSGSAAAAGSPFGGGAAVPASVFDKLEAIIANTTMVGRQGYQQPKQPMPPVPTQHASAAPAAMAAQAPEAWGAQQQQQQQRQQQAVAEDEKEEEDPASLPGHAEQQQQEQQAAPQRQCFRCGATRPGSSKKAVWLSEPGTRRQWVCRPCYDKAYAKLNNQQQQQQQQRQQQQQQRKAAPVAAAAAAAVAPPSKRRKTLQQVDAEASSGGEASSTAPAEAALAAPAAVAPAAPQVERRSSSRRQPQQVAAPLAQPPEPPEPPQPPPPPQQPCAALEAAGVLQSVLLLWQNARLFQALFPASSKGSGDVQHMLDAAAQRYSGAVDQLCRHYSVDPAAIEVDVSWQALSRLLRRGGQQLSGQERAHWHGIAARLQQRLLQLLPRLPRPLPAALDPDASLQRPASRKAAVVLACCALGARRDCLGEPVAGFPGQALCLVGIGTPLHAPNSHHATHISCRSCTNTIIACKAVPAAPSPQRWEPSVPFAASRRTELLASALRILLSAAQHSVLPFFTPVGASWQRCATDFLADLLAHSASPSLGSSRSSGRRVPTAAEVLRQAEQYCFLASQLGEGEQAAAGVRRCSVRSAACLGFGPNRVFLPFIMSYNAHPKVDACAACFASKHRVHRS